MLQNPNFISQALQAWQSASYLGLQSTRDAACTLAAQFPDYTSLQKLFVNEQAQLDGGASR